MNNQKVNLDDATIKKVGLVLTSKPINAHIAPDARIFRFPGVEKLYIMESDLYGNTMPEDSCFVAFYGKNGLVGKHLRVETLVTMTKDDMRSLMESNCNG